MMNSKIDSTLSAEEIKDEKRDILLELEHRKKANPLDFHKLLRIQQLFHDCISKLKCLFGGNRSGKTEGIADYVIRKCIEKPDQKWWVVGESFSDSVNIQQKKIWALVPRNRIKYGSYDEINGFTNRKLLFDNNSMITFKSYDQKRDAFQSDDLDGIWQDEEPPNDIYKECRMRLLDRDGEMLISMTSLKGVTELIQDIYEDHEVIESKYCEMVNEELPRIAEKDGAMFFHLWTPENPHIVQERVEFEAKLLPRDEKKSRLFGIPINLSGKIYVMMSKHIHVTTMDDMPEGDYTLYNILDPHDRKPWAISWIAVHKTGTAYVVDEYPNRPFTEMKYDDKTYKEYAKIIKQKESALKELFGVGVSRRILDPNFGNKTVQLAQRQGGQSSTTPKKELQRLGLHYKDGIDAIEAGHLEVRSWLYYDRADSGEIVVQPKLMFCDTCTNHIMGMLRYSRKDVTTASGDEKDRVGPQEKWKDFPDCIRYGVMSKLRYIEPYKEPEFKKAY